MREQTTIRLPEELMEELKREADRKGYSFNQLVMIMITEYISHQK